MNKEKKKDSETQFYVFFDISTNLVPIKIQINASFDRYIAFELSISFQLDSKDGGEGKTINIISNSQTVIQQFVGREKKLYVLKILFTNNNNTV